MKVELVKLSESISSVTPFEFFMLKEKITDSSLYIFKEENLVDIKSKRGKVLNTSFVDINLGINVNISYYVMKQDDIFIVYVIDFLVEKVLSDEVFVNKLELVEKTLVKFKDVYNKEEFKLLGV